MLKLVLVSTFNNFEKVHLPKLGEIEGCDLFCLFHLPLERLDLRLIMAIRKFLNKIWFLKLSVTLNSCFETCWFSIRPCILSWFFRSSSYKKWKGNAMFLCTLIEEDVLICQWWWFKRILVPAGKSAPESFFLTFSGYSKSFLFSWIYMSLIYTYLGHNYTCA